MAKFCTKCGRKLEEGEVCNCSQNNVSAQSTSTTSTAGSIDINEGFNDYLNIIKGIFTRPSDTIKEYAKGDKFLLGIIAIVINCLISGVFFYFFVDKAFGSAMGIFGGYGSLMSSAGMSLPFGRIFFMGLLFMVFWFAVCALVLFVIANPILKDKMDIKTSFALVGVCSIFTTLTTIVALILTFMSVKFAFIVLLLGAIFYLTHLYQGLSDITNINKNKLVYTFIPAVALATFVMVEIVPKFFS